MLKTKGDIFPRLDAMDQRPKNTTEVMRSRSSTVSRVSNITREFPDMNNHGTKQEGRTLSTGTPLGSNTDRSDDSVIFGNSLLIYEHMRSSNREKNESLQIIKQRRTSFLRSMFLNGRDTNNNDANYISPLTKGRSVSAPTNGLQMDFNTLDNIKTCESTNTFNDDIFNLTDDALTMGADKRVSFYSEALLHDVIQRDDLNELCDLLNKEKDLNLDKPGIFGLTPLHRAAIEGSYRCMNLLLSRNVSVKVCDIYGWTPLHDAVYHGHIRCAAALITAGSNVEAETNDFTKPIEMAHEDDMLLLVGRAMTSPGYVYDPDRETLV